MNSILMTLGIFLSSISSTACLIPDDYVLVITVKTNETYLVTYKGEVLFAPAVEAMINGEYDEYKDEQVKQIVKEFENTEGMKTVEYLGGGRFYLELKVTKDIGDDFHFVSDDLTFFEIWSSYGELKIDGMEMSEDVKNELKSVNIDMNGRFRVRCQPGISVVNHNANSVAQKKNTTNYNWALNLDTSIPDITIRYDEEEQDDFVSSDKAKDMLGFRFYYQNHTNNSNGTSTWNYTVKPGPDASSNLFHWVLGLSEGHEVKTASSSYTGQITNDSDTKLYGITFDEKIKKNDDEHKFSFTLTEQYETETIPVAMKAASKISESELYGPSPKPLGFDDDDMSTSENSTEMAGFKYIYLGYENNSDGTSTWKYNVRSSASTSEDLSYWVLALNEEHEVIKASTSNSGELTEDWNTGVYGVKFNQKIKKIYESYDYYFTLNSQYSEAEVTLASMVDNKKYLSSIIGPGSSSIVIGENSTEIEGYIFTYLDHQNNNDGSSTWNYEVSSTGTASNDLTEWVLGLEDLHEVVDGDGFKKVETHKHSGVYGAVFNEKVKKHNDSESYSLTLEYQYEPKEVKIGMKAGSLKGTEYLMGPSNIRLNEPEEIDGEDIDGYVFAYIRHTDNNDGSSTWYYSVTSNGSAKHDMSHWVLALDAEHDVIGASDNFKKVEDDKETKLYGIKFDEKVKKENDSELFDFTLSKQYESKSVEIGYKAGSEKASGYITGPSDIELNDSEWQSSGAMYYVGEIVSYNGKEYKCKISHRTYGDMNWAPDKAYSLWEHIDQDDDGNSSEILDMVTFFDKIITDFYNNYGYYPRTWGDYAYTDLGLNPGDYEDVYFNNFEFKPRGSKLLLCLEEGYNVNVITIFGEDVKIKSRYNWNLIYDTVTNYWYYHSESPNKMINIESLEITEAD